MGGFTGALPGEFGLWGASKTPPGLHHVPRLAGGWPTTPAQRVSCLNCRPCGQVDPEGFEPSTFSMPLRRAPNCAMGPSLSRQSAVGSRQNSVPLAAYCRLLAPACLLSCGPGGIRTLDLLSAIETRSQLRYRPASGDDCT